MVRTRKTGQDYRTAAELAAGLGNLKADLALASSPFNISDWSSGRVQHLNRREYGLPAAGCPNAARVQYTLRHRGPAGGFGLTLAKGFLCCSQASDPERSRRRVETYRVN